MICADCKQEVADEEYLTQINPEGGYNRPQVLICDDCMLSGRWNHWINEHWPNWPENTQRSPE